MRLSTPGVKPPPDEPNHYHLITFDPGGRTGWARFVVDRRAFSRPEHKVLAWLISWDSGEFSGSENEQCGQAQWLIRQSLKGQHRPRIEVVGEDFELTQMVGGKELLSPVRINAVMDWMCAGMGITYQLQARHLRTLITRDWLRTAGLHKRFGKDEFSAVQHNVTWLRRIKAQSRKRPWKLSDGTTENAFWDCICEEGRPGEHDLLHPA